jgi:nicotinamide-nucleotide amidase
MPGVPFEMKAMMENYVLKQLPGHFTLPHIAHRTLLTAGVGESFLAEKIIGFEEALPPHIKLAYLPSFGMVRLRISTSGHDKDIIEKELDILFSELQLLVKEYLVTNKDEPLQNVVANLLIEKNKTISTAESCTGGYIAHLLTEAAGASAYFEGGIISYSYQAKEDLLEVDKKMLETSGAVSEEIVHQMAAGAITNFKTGYAIAVSGIMGPAGGTTEKPVGTVWIAVGNKKRIEAKQYNFRFDRQRNIQLTAVNALNMMRLFILEDTDE